MKSETRTFIDGDGFIRTLSYTKYLVYRKEFPEELNKPLEYEPTVFDILEELLRTNKWG